jgi:hypothetical protein
MQPWQGMPEGYGGMDILADMHMRYAPWHDDATRHLEQPSRHGMPTVHECVFFSIRHAVSHCVSRVRPKLVALAITPHELLHLALAAVQLCLAVAVQPCMGEQACPHREQERWFFLKPRDRLLCQAPMCVQLDIGRGMTLL